MYGTATTREGEGTTFMPPSADETRSSLASETQSTERYEFGATGLSAVRELALALGLADEETPALWPEA